jgi:hypothetical protein
MSNLHIIRAQILRIDLDFFSIDFFLVIAKFLATGWTFSFVLFSPISLIDFDALFKNRATNYYLLMFPSPLESI